MIVQTLIEPFQDTNWMIAQWHVKFLLSERLLTHARKKSTKSNWYEDPHIADTWSEVITHCFRSVEAYYLTFRMLPIIGDRLFDEDTGWRIQDRTIDGDLMTITFTLDS